MPTVPANHKPPKASVVRHSIATTHTKTTTERGYGYRWQKRRAAVMRRDKGLCQECLRGGRYTTATDVDHIKRKADGGTDHPDNLQSLCRPCHKAKTRLENGGKDISCTPDGIPLDKGHHWNS